MTVVELRFPARRYHGTPWGRHVNEGVCEWPPSPYRLIRALYDAWQRKCTHLSAARVTSVLEVLGSSLPVFRLPKAVASHTRSYLSSNTEHSSDKSLIFDAFVTVAPGASCYMEWPGSVTDEQRDTLRQLLSALNYLGRSESWVDAGLAANAPTGLKSCVPVDSANGSGDLVEIACPIPPQAYSGKQPWLDALTYSTTSMLKERRSSPPAMRNVPYVRETGAVVTWLSPGRRRKSSDISALAIALGGRVLPRATDTVVIAERLRAALMKTLGHSIPSVFHGKDANGKPLRGHQHLFILPQQNRAGRIDRVLLCSRQPLDERTLEAIRALRILHPFDYEYPLRTIVTWAGQRFHGPHWKTATTLVSATPFVTVRHWRKGRGCVDDFLAEEIRRECRNHGFPEPVSVEPQQRLAGSYLPVHYRRNRRDDTPRPGYAFAISFAEPQHWPFSLGYGCHFGLGQFVAQD